MEKQEKRFNTEIVKRLVEYHPKYRDRVDEDGNFIRNLQRKFDKYKKDYLANYSYDSGGGINDPYAHVIEILKKFDECGIQVDFSSQSKPL